MLLRRTDVIHIGPTLTSCFLVTSVVVVSETRKYSNARDRIPKGYSIQKFDCLYVFLSVSRQRERKMHYSKSFLQRMCFTADTSIQRTPLLRRNYIKLWPFPYKRDLSIADISIADTFSQNQQCPLQRGSTIVRYVHFEN